MSQLISLDNVTLAFGLEPLLDQVKLQIMKGERVCLIGRNGAGKSSLLKIIEGSIQPDSGTVAKTQNVKIARLTQELPQNSELTTYEYVASGLSECGELLAEYHALTHQLEVSQDERLLNRLNVLQEKMDAANAWDMEQRINTVLSQLALVPDKKIAELSGGWLRRAALAKVLVAGPDLLLLDEPTNHLDISAIQWLENLLTTLNIAILFITHDRSFLQRLATRIIELDRGQLTSWPGDYANFLRRKEEMLHAEALENAAFDKKLAEEERWIRQGIKARRTRNEGRVRALKAMRSERSQRREVQGKSKFEVNTADKSGKLIIEAKDVTHRFDDKLIINQFSCTIMRGDRIGLIGPNGVGKSTLLNILLGNLEPQEGTVRLGTNLQIAYFDQLRATIDPAKTVFDNVANGSDELSINGQKKHIISYLNDFLFTPARSRTPAGALSGGEANRLVLAKLFSQPSNLLVLDEPTNDLDIETLELLEELLTEYQGTLLIVSHDRAFLDNLVTSIYVFEDNGRITEYVGGYQDYINHAKSEMQIVKDIAETKVRDEVKAPARKMSYKDQRELENLPKEIELLEQEQHHLQTLVADASFYQRTPSEVTSTLEQLQKLTAKIEAAYARWEILDQQSKA